VTPPVLIVGSHRSGTSATAQALHRLGFYAGSRVNAEHLEPNWIAGIHDRYLWETGGAWYRPGPTLQYLSTPQGGDHFRRYLAGKIHGRLGHHSGFLRRFAGTMQAALLLTGRVVSWGWKEPRTTLFARFYAEFFPGLKFIHVVRHPIDVALSLQRRELAAREEGEPPCPGLEELATCVALVECYVEEGVGLSDNGERYLEVRFEDIQDDPEARLRELSRFCGLEPGARLLADAARSIDTRRRSRFEQLPDASVETLMRLCPLAARFGY